MADAGGCHWAGNIGHGVVDGEAGGDGTTWGVDVQIYGFLWSVGFEEEELGHNGGRDAFVDGAVEADNTLLSGLSAFEGRITRQAGSLP